MPFRRYGVFIHFELSGVEGYIGGQNKFYGFLRFVESK
jgi:hypothetical protein